MPFGTVHNSPQLTDEEAWDVAAYVNSQPRPQVLFKYDWPDIKSKPVDYPFGPYADGYNEEQHKFGPFTAIKKAKENLAKTSAANTKK
jgi:thiosulfate dehydrogenase